MLYTSKEVVKFAKEAVPEWSFNWPFQIKINEINNNFHILHWRNKEPNNKIIDSDKIIAFWLKTEHINLHVQGYQKPIPKEL